MGEPMGWIVLLVVLVFIELITMGLTTIWFAGGALIAAILALLGLPFYVQLIGFLLVSFVLLFFTRPIARKYFNGNRVKTNAESLAGKKAVVTKEINNLQNQGQVKESGMEWTARSVSDDCVIPEGTVVRIEEIRGVKLIVRPDETVKEKQAKIRKKEKREL